MVLLFMYGDMFRSFTNGTATRQRLTAARYVWIGHPIYFCSSSSMSCTLDDAVRDRMFIDYCMLI